MNALLSFFALNSTGFGPIVARVGDLPTYAGSKYIVKYKGKKIPDAFWQYGVGMPTSWSKASIVSLGENASRPGTPYVALQNALGKFNDNSTLETALQASKVNQEQTAPSLSMFSSSPPSNISNIIYNRKGLPIGTYGLWDAPDGKGKYAVWKLKGFGILVGLTLRLALKTCFFEQ